MKKFIRLDFDKGFRGTEHISSFGGDGERFEKGISCYEISRENVIEAVNNLCKYWFEVATECDFTNYDINIFEGKKVGYGTDGEDLATCQKHLHCISGELFNEIYDLYYKHDTYIEYKDDEEMLECEEYIITEEFENKIKEMFRMYI